jgi:hypothetical protein
MRFTTKPPKIIELGVRFPIFIKKIFNIRFYENSKLATSGGCLGSSGKAG